MRRMYWIAALMLALACQSARKPAAPTDGVRTFGEKLAPGEKATLSAVLAAGDRYANKVITVEGAVRKACTRKGCWMELAESTSEGTPGCRVSFKDYGFFVPIDSAGSRARVQGVVTASKLPAASVRHYEEEGAVFANKEPDGSAHEVRIVATGVELWREPR
jgi:Domain of unknown function (DUF4920)